MDKLFLPILFVLGSLSLSAQRSINFQFAHTIPVGEFADNLMHRPNGVAFEYMFTPIKDKKFQLGASLQVSMYQNENHSGEVALTDSQNAYIETNEDDCFYTYQGMARYYITKEQALLRPYVQGQFGGATFFSSLSMIEDPEEAFEADSRTHGTTYLAGLGGGLAIRIFDTMYIDANLSYNTSGETNYRSSPESNPAAQYRIDLSSHQQTSKVNHMALKLGMNILF